MKFVSWNVNGLRACLKKNFMKSFQKLDADIFAVQETRMLEGQVILELDGYSQFWNSAEKKGYSGTAIFARIQPRSVTYGIGVEEHDKQGRVITLGFSDFYFVTVYTPNSHNLEWIDYRLKWEDAFREYVQKLNAVKPVIICGDLNVAHNEIDLKNPAQNHNVAGFSDSEREKFNALLNIGFIDTFRYLFPEKTEAYTWWDYRNRARERNSGWRIDYFLVSNRLAEKISDATIEAEIFGSDHCPVTLTLNDE